MRVRRRLYRPTLRARTARTAAALLLVLAFCTSAALWMQLQAEFLAITLVLVYVGAVMVLFLFVVMMLDIDFAELKAEMSRYMPLALLIGAVILMQLGMALGVWNFSEVSAENLAAPIGDTQNTAALGLLIYDKYIILFQLAGLILLVAMIGAIVLTLRHRVDIKRQNVMQQMHRDPAKAMELKDMKPGQGL